MSDTKPIEGLTTAVVEAAERNRIGAYLTKLKGKEAFTKAERDDFEFLFEKYRSDRPKVADPQDANRKSSLEARVEIINGATKDFKGIKTPASKHLRTLMADVVLEWYVQGKTRAWISQQVAELWGYSQRSADSLISDAKIILVENGQKERTGLRGIASVRLDIAFAAAQAAADPSGMVKAVAAFADLFGLNEPKLSTIKGEMDYDITSGGQPIIGRVVLPDDGSGVTR